MAREESELSAVSSVPGLGVDGFGEPAELERRLEEHYGALRDVAHEIVRSGVSTPFSLFDVERAAANVDGLRAVAREHPGLEVRIHVATKACYVPEVLTHIAPRVDAFDVQSTHEAGVAPGSSPLAFHSPLLPRDALSQRVRSVSLNTERQWQQLSASGVGPGVTHVGVRIALPARGGEFIASGGKFGTPRNAVAGVLRGIRDLGRRGFLHHHTHARLHDVKEAASTLRRFCAVVNEIGAELPEPVDTVDIGGGWDGGFELAIRGLSAAELLRVQLDELVRGSPSVRAVVVEPGRVIFEDTSIVVTRIREIIRSPDGVFVVLDVATNFLVPLPAARFRVIPMRNRGTSPQRYVFVDGTCSPRGVIAEQWLSSILVEDDLVGIVNTGSYTHSVASFFHSPPPPVIVAHVDRGNAQRL